MKSTTPIYEQLAYEVELARIEAAQPRWRPRNRFRDYGLITVGTLVAAVLVLGAFAGVIR